MPSRILLVEDDPEISEFVAQGLREEGHFVGTASNGHDAQKALTDAQWDLVVLDWWLPGPDGLSLLQRFRGAGKTTPVLFLTARDAVSQRVEGLKSGADDYLCKPFAYEEFLARVEVLLRRGPSAPTPVWRHLDVVLDLSQNRAERAGKPLNLATREQALLHFFLRHPGEVLTRARLYERVWDETYDGQSNTLEVHVMELRKKLEAHGPRLIHTVRGKGYMLGSHLPAEGASEGT